MPSFILFKGLELHRPSPCLPSKRIAFEMDGLKTLRALTRSPDLWFQYHPQTGVARRPFARNDCRSAYLDAMGKLTGHPLTVSLMLLAIHVNAIEDSKAAHKIID